MLRAQVRQTLIVSLFAACGDKEAVCDLTGANECSVELETGDLLRVKLPPAAFVESDGRGGGTQYRWGLFRR